MFDWLSDAIGGAFNSLWAEVSGSIWDIFLKWIYNAIYNAVADFFTSIGNMGVEIFDLTWVASALRLFSLLGWALFITGMAVTIFDVAIEYQSNGRINIRTAALNVLKGFMAVNLFTTVPIELYKSCITLQNTFARDLSGVFSGEQGLWISSKGLNVLGGPFFISGQLNASLFNIFVLVAFAYCIIKIFFANIKRGGILLTQIAVGTLYMFSIPRGYADGFNQWIKQIIALCLTAFMQTTLLFLGLLTFPTHMLLGLGIMLSANEVPRIAQQFGLDTSVKVNMMSAVHTTTTAVNLSRALVKK